MNSSFNFYIPTNIVFGPGRIKELASMELPGKKALIVTTSGKSVIKFGYLDMVKDALREHGIESVVFNKILPNPTLDHVMEGAQVARDSNCDFIIGLGGGSPIDSAKSIAIMVNNPGNYWDYIPAGTGKGKSVTEPVLPLVAIPTTAGTGTEADPWTVITNMETQEKIGFGLVPDTFPVISIVDPELMVSIPPHLTAYQGMDAFFHAAEGYLATVSQPASDHFALGSIELINKFLPRAVKDGSDLEARTALAWASTQSGLVESTSCCISQHSMEHALSAFDPAVPHGAGLILLSIPYFTFMAEKAPERFPAMAKAMGVNVDALPENERPMAFVKALKELITAIDCDSLSIKDFKLEKSQCEALADNAMTAMGFLFDLDPYKMSKEECVAIFEQVFEG
ncbi:iron-containing alcohol dehydrogenase [Desulfovibrio sp. JC010]|uniref:iron-containing alcohol dehydrogenase n=1 Tax=Desulfovibrio sp. JC010 TaxID=2593641 RepID=UPI0013D1236C|nr:iron-containing alcohol dehydrogenase [Desulfovibrio sp. JC010]NDV28389.1 iron-containing alcohol dehydrogenase [Desulfovibrio sp. JC010]